MLAVIQILLGQSVYTIDLFEKDCSYVIGTCMPRLLLNAQAMAIDPYVASYLLSSYLHI